MDLFGFATMMELNCFKMLTAVSGVGAEGGACHFERAFAGAGGHGRGIGGQQIADPRQRAWAQSWRSASCWN